jgi:hypothetical protein
MANRTSEFYRKAASFDRSFAQIYLPLAFEPQKITRNFHGFGAMVLLREGVTIDKARANVLTLILSHGLGMRAQHWCSALSALWR